MHISYWYFFARAGFWALVFCMQFLCAGQDSLRLIFTQDTKAALLKQWCPEPFLLHDCSFEADVPMDQQELQYLAHLPAGCLADAQALVHALQLLEKKNSFYAITLVRTPTENGYCLHCRLEGLWRVASVAVRGWMLGKERYRASYLLEEGQLFDHTKHLDSLEKIRQQFYEDGFFNAKVEGSLTFDELHKLVAVTISLSKEQQFYIQSATCRVVGAPLQADCLAKTINKRFLKMLRSARYSKKLLNKQAANIMQFCAREGFANVHIGLEEQFDRLQCAVSMVWVVEVAQKKEAIFLGNRFFSAKKLRELLADCGQSGVLLPASLLADEIMQAYHAKGFWQATVTAQEEDARSFYVINEGPRSRLRSVIVPEKQTLHVQALLKRCCADLLAGGYFDEQYIKKTAARLAVACQQDGFADARAAGDLVPAEGEHEYDLVIHLDVGVKKRKEKIALPTGARFGKTVMVGDPGVPFAYVQRELQYCDGDAWDTEKITATVKRLKQLELFESVRLRPEYTYDDDMEKTMILELRKDDPFEVRFRIGAGLQRVYDCGRYARGTYRIGGALVYKNPFCVADQLMVDADFSRSYRRLIARYMRPWLGDLPVKTVVELYANRHEHPGFIGHKKNLYEVKQAGIYARFVWQHKAVEIGASTGFQFDELSVCTFDSSGCFNKQERIDAVARAIIFKRELFERRIPYFFVAHTLAIDHVDNPVDPAAGYYGTLALKAMVPLRAKYAHAAAFKAGTEHSFFAPIGPFVFAAHVQAGHIFYQCFNHILPTERFYLGGPRSIRSYEYGMCPPLGVIEPTPQGPLIVPQGGKTSLSGSLEMRFPLNQYVKAVIFQDVGFLSNGLHPGGCVAASGFGLRLPTPLGPLAFDMGWKWHHRLGVFPGYAWFLTFGRAF